MARINFEKIVDIKTFLRLYKKYKNPLRKIGKRVSIIISISIIGLAVAEVLLRYYAQHSKSPLLVEKKEPIDYLELARPLPGEIVCESKCNRLGYFDGQEFVKEKKPGLKRVVAIADSFGSIMVPCRYHAFTKAEIFDGNPPRWEIYNL